MKLKMPTIKKKPKRVRPRHDVARHRRREEQVVIPPWSDERGYSGRHRLNTSRRHPESDKYTGRHRKGAPRRSDSRYDREPVRRHEDRRLTAMDDRPRRRGYYA